MSNYGIYFDGVRNVVFDKRSGKPLEEEFSFMCAVHSAARLGRDEKKEPEKCSSP